MDTTESVVAELNVALGTDYQLVRQLTGGLQSTAYELTGGVVLKWTDNPAQKLSPDVPKILVPGPGGFPGGFVHIAIDQTKATTLPGACTKAFQVVAVLVIDWSPNNPIV